PVIDQLFQSQCLTQAVPHAFGVGRDDQLPTVTTGEGTIGGDGVVACSLRLLGQAADHRVDGLIGQHRQLPVEHRHVDVATAAWITLLDHCGKYTYGREHSGNQITGRDPQAYRCAVRITCQAHHS